jgi:TolB-like protein/DNA-binding winged helix-turn-helix (wHTH) protein
MSEHGEGAERYGFEQFMLDPERSELHGPDGVIQLRPKSYDLLLYLVRHPGRLIGREELLDAVWGQRAVTDDSVTQCLVEIRRALADHGRRIVRTVPRRGYLFDVPVARIPGPNGPEEQANVPAADAPASATAPPAALHGAMPYPRLAAATVTFLALALAWWAFATRDATRPDRSMFDAPAVPNSIAVLPFADMSAEGDQEYFGDGIAEEILNLLAQAPELKVIARTSSFSFKHQPADITTIAARLGVAHVLEGSVRKWGNRVRVTAQLVSGRDGAHLWSQTYDRELGDLFEVQGDIAGAVAGVLEARLLTRPGVAVTPEARDVRA